jgi:hypothetical protein
VSETLIPSKPEQRICLLGANDQLEHIDVIAWSIAGSGPPAPITPYGRVDASKGYVLSTESGWLVFPSGQTFYNDQVGYLQQYLVARRGTA